MTPGGGSGWRRIRGRLEMAAYRELRPLVREGRIRPRTAIVGAAMALAVLVNAGTIVFGLSSGDEGAASVGKSDAREAGAEIDTRRYDVLEGLNDTPGDGLAAMNAGNERARLLDARGKVLPRCGEDVMFEDPRAADFCD